MKEKIKLVYESEDFKGLKREIVIDFEPESINGILSEVKNFLLAISYSEKTIDKYLDLE